MFAFSYFNIHIKCCEHWRSWLHIHLCLCRNAGAFLTLQKCPQGNGISEKCFCFEGTDKVKWQYNDVSNQQDATTFSFINLLNSALHVSGDKFTHHQEHFLTYTGCNRRNGPDFGTVFLRSYYTDITQNTYIQSSMVTEILAREV